MKWFLTQCGWLVIFVCIAVGTISFWANFSFSDVLEPMLFTTLACVIMGNTARALFSAVVFGVLFDLFSALPFGIGVISYIAAVAVVFFLQQTIFKQKAAHIMALHMLIGVYTFHLVLFLIELLIQRISTDTAVTLSFSQTFVMASIQAVVSIFLIIVVNLCMHFFSETIYFGIAHLYD